MDGKELYDIFNNYDKGLAKYFRGLYPTVDFIAESQMFLDVTERNLFIINSNR